MQIGLELQNAVRKRWRYAVRKRWRYAVHTRLTASAA